MSYEIVRSIKVKDNKVFVRADSNNVYPKDFSEREAEVLTKKLQEEGKEALNVYIMEAYESGTFQTRGNNKYTRALQILRHSPDYHRFDWRNNWDESQKTRGNEEYKALLKKCLETKLPKEKFIIQKDYFGKTVYLWKMTKRGCQWHNEQTKAKIFRYKEDAENLHKNFQNANNWQTTAI